jgi:4-cresol dehydrogenase (hydroxylating) flavoprotein subunit
MLDRVMTGTGLDWDPAMIVGPRFIINIAQIYFPPADEEITARAYQLYPRLIREGGALGYAPYRTHLDVMDEAADQFDFGDHALLRFNERLKDTLDPAGILAPGKQGIWPRGSAHRVAEPAH